MGFERIEDENKIKVTPSSNMPRELVMSANMLPRISSKKNLTLICDLLHRGDNWSIRVVFFDKIATEPIIVGLINVQTNLDIDD